MPKVIIHKKHTVELYRWISLCKMGSVQQDSLHLTKDWFNNSLLSVTTFGKTDKDHVISTIKSKEIKVFLELHASTTITDVVLLKNSPVIVVKTSQPYVEPPNPRELAPTTKSFWRNLWKGNG